MIQINCHTPKLIALCIIISLCLGCPKSKEYKKLRTVADYNNDGIVSFNEAKSYRDSLDAVTDTLRFAAALFHQWDVDSNSFVDLKEFPFRESIFREIARNDKGFNQEGFSLKYSNFLDNTTMLLSKDNGWYIIYDKNEDGQISKDELSNIIQDPNTQFAKEFDLNNNGVIEEFEINELTLSLHLWRPVQVSLAINSDFQKYDINSDALLDSTELQYNSDLIPIFDRDFDGAISKPEISAIDSIETASPSPLREYQIQTFFKRLDTDDNDVLDTFEMIEYTPIFNYLDSDKSNNIDQFEIKHWDEAFMSLLEKVVIDTL